MSGSGNMIPQSRTTIRPSTSMQAQLRPISPRPPRKTTRTGFGLQAIRQRRHRDHRRAARPPGSWPPGRRARARPRRGKPALAGGQAEGPAGGLGRQRVGVLRARLEVVGLDQPALPATAASRSPGEEGVDHRPISGPAQWTATLTDPDGADRQEGQRQVVVAAVDLEAVGGLGHQAGRRRRHRRRRPSPPRCWGRRGPAAAWCAWRSGARRARGCRRASTGGRRGLGHGREVIGQARLRGPAVVRGHHQHPVDPASAGPLRQLDGVRGCRWCRCRR